MRHSRKEMTEESRNSIFKLIESIYLDQTVALSKPQASALYLSIHKFIEGRRIQGRIKQLQQTSK